MSAAEQIVAFSGGRGPDLLFDYFESLIDASGSEKILGRVRSVCDEGGEDYGSPD
jgi:hypothetical protein